jgi:hypothetical protein
MADQRQSRNNDYLDIPGEVFIMKNLSSFGQISGDASVVTVSGSQGFIPPPIVLQRSPPSYNEASDSRPVAVLDGYVPAAGQGVKPKIPQQPPAAVAGPSTEPEYESNISSNAFDEFIIEGYENVTNEPSQCTTKLFFYFKRFCVVILRGYFTMADMCLFICR